MPTNPPPVPVTTLGVWGDDDAIRTRVQAHDGAGANDVCVQPLAPDPDDLRRLDWRVLDALVPAQ
jgi:hypothetical protein